MSSKSHLGGKGGKFTQATFFNRFQPFLDYISINLPSSAAVIKKCMDCKLEGASEYAHDHSGDEANNMEKATYCPQDYY